MAREIPLTRGLVAIVDDDDYDRLTDHSWHAHKTKAGWYARSFAGYMHRLVVEAVSGEEVDHQNGNGLDNRRSNLRRCSHSLNVVNRTYARSVSPYRGVHQQRTRSGAPSRWVARVTLNGITHRKFGFLTAEEAARAYDAMAVHLHGPFAQLNFPEVVQ